jgi:hypothetical protein
MTLAVVAGALANKPWNGGNAWSRISWLLGFRRLGLDVHFLELAGEEGREYFELVLGQFGLTGTLGGVPAEVAEQAELLVNIGGHLPLEPPVDRIPVKVYFDDDPGYTQIWQETGVGGAGFEGHDAYYTLGTNIGLAGCPIPTAGIDWRPLVPPVVLEEWPVSSRAGEAFTTVASWRGAYGPVEWEGITYGGKAREFRKFAELPRLVAAPFEIALDIHPGDERDRQLLEDNGWRLTDPRAAAGTPDDFRRYVQDSLAEFSAAQGVYAGTASGWFSDRTTRYLAAGRPALVQETGFTVPAGEGLVAFASLGEAAAGARRILAAYETHAAAARWLAQEHFDSDKVLGRLLAEVLP